MPSTPHPFTPTLNLFLASISTSASLISAAPLLLVNGIDSVDKLVFLMSLSEEGVNGFASLLAERGVPKLSTLLLKKGVVEAQKRTNQDQEAVVGEESRVKLE